MKEKASRFIGNFFALEASGGILLILGAIFAVICANSGLVHLYEGLLHLHPFAWIPGFNQLGLNLSFHHFTNDALMAVFFLLVGLELKREIMEGELSDKRNVMLPVVGAVGGMVLPALIYFLLNHGDPFAVHGWAIPAATDIAFALGVLTLLGSRIPYSIKIFLTSLAIFDDLGAIQEGLHRAFIECQVGVPHSLAEFGVGQTSVLVGRWFQHLRGRPVRKRPPGLQTDTALQTPRPAAVGGRPLLEN